jgi:hypothetical protein
VCYDHEQREITPQQQELIEKYLRERLKTEEAFRALFQPIPPGRLPVRFPRG